MMITSKRALVGSLLLLGLGCTDSDDSDDTITDQDPGTAVDASVGGGDDAGGPGQEQDAGTQTDLSDAEIAAVSTVANQGEVQQGMIALQRAQSEPVRMFAQMMVTEHQAALDRETKLLQMLGIAPEQNAISRMLKSESDAIVMQLENQEGAAFDRLYMDSQVTVHTMVLQLIDARLIPSAEQPVLETELRTMRASVEMHLMHAQEVREGLEQAGDAGTGGDDDKPDGGS
jgi:putative membrane protein